MDNEKIWIENPRILITNYKNFIPKKQSSKVSQINALTQLLLYVFIVTLIFGINTKLINIIIFGLIVLLVIIYYYKYASESKEEDMTPDISLEGGYYDSNNKLHMGKFYSQKNKPVNHIARTAKEMAKYYKESQRKPTPDNPFMNPIFSDYNTENIPFPSNADDEDIKEEITKSFDENLFKDLDDVFDIKNSQRIFYTVPGGAIPNDQDKFARWCNALPTTCKEDSLSCYKNLEEDLRYTSQYKFN
jgi:hypothetical protein